MADTDKDINIEDTNTEILNNPHEDILQETNLVGQEHQSVEDKQDEGKVYVEEHIITNSNDKIQESEQIFVEEHKHEVEKQDIQVENEDNRVESPYEQISQELKEDSQLAEDSDELENVTKEIDEIHISKEESNINPEEAKKAEFLKELEEITGAMEEQKKAGNHLNTKEPINPTKEQLEEYEKSINESFIIYHKGVEVAVPYFNEIETKHIDKSIPAVHQFLGTLKLLYSNSALSLQKMRKYAQCIEYDNYVYTINIDHR
jgi:hypothetical protein